MLGTSAPAGMTTYLVGIVFHSRTISTGQWAWRTTESETLPISALLSPHALCCPSPPIRPLYPLPGGRSPLLHLPSSGAPVRPFHLPTVLVLPPRRAVPCLVALRAARYPPPGSGPVALLPQGRSLPGKAEQSARYPRRGSRAVPSRFAYQDPPRSERPTLPRWTRLWPVGSWSERCSSRPPRSTPHSQSA